MEKIQAHEVMKAGIDLQENASKKLYTESSTTYVSNVKKRTRKPKDKLLENVSGIRTLPRPDIGDQIPVAKKGDTLSDILNNDINVSSVLSIA